MEFVSIPPGSFSMGSPDSEKDGYGDEGPVRSVEITRAFYMGRYEVTQDQYMAVMGRNPSKFSGGNLPVETVSWEEAVAFCEKIGGRLPTEAEWEYACRAGSETQFCYGDDPNYAQLGEYAWYPGNSGSTTHAIGQKKPNSFGLYDMHGNVYEWCSDWFAAYANEQTVDPVGPPSGQSRVCRGGGWRRFARYCRSAARNHSSPGSGGGLIGFRVAYEQ
jgi:formylglycine-generating enzyme required for sulfatase activity